MDKPTPRINSAMLGDHQGLVVRLSGKVIRLDGDSAVVEASDQGQVCVKLTRDSNFSDAFVEVLGRVNEDLTIQEYRSTNLGNTFDMKLNEATVQLMQTRPDMFPHPNA